MLSTYGMGSESVLRIRLCICTGSTVLDTKHISLVQPSYSFNRICLEIERISGYSGTFTLLVSNSVAAKHVKAERRGPQKLARALGHEQRP